MMRKTNEVTIPVVLLDNAVEDLANEVRIRAIQSAAETLAGKILDRINKEASVRRMRQESIAKARQILAGKRDKRAAPKAKPGPKPAAKPAAKPEAAPAMVTEVRKLTAGPTVKVRKKATKVEQAAAPADAAHQA